MKRNSPTPSSFGSIEQLLGAASLMAQMDRAYSLKEEEQFLSLQSQLYELLSCCEQQMEEFFMERAQMLDWDPMWKEMSAYLWGELKKRKKEVIHALAHPKACKPEESLMHLLWFFSDGMMDPKRASLLNSKGGFWGFSIREKEPMSQVLAHFLFALGFINKDADYKLFKSGIERFHSMMPQNYVSPQPPLLDYFAGFKEAVEAYCLDYFHLELFSWPKGWPSVEDSIQKALNLVSASLSHLL